MNRESAEPDQGIRTIFSSAMEVEPASPAWRRRLRHLCSTRTAGHAVVGCSFGASSALLAFLLVALSAPHMVSADTGLDPEPKRPTAAIAKADRLPVPTKLAAAASAVDYYPGRSLAVFDATSPVLGYASEEKRGAAMAAIDGHVDDGRVQVASLGDPTLVVPGAAAAATDEEDDEAIIPIPRARPAAPPVAATPLPRPRPAHVASLMPPEDEGETASGSEPGEAEVAPQPRPGGTALGFFSSPTDPVKAPPKVTIDTPFGIPYVLQTGSVETACLQPPLVDLLRRIETHYHQKVVITSGFRDRGRQGSLHRQCAAADIQVNGVTAQQLAAFARTIPGIGGVGTYCHPSMIHVDIGQPRDWKYGCGSFFAMRGAPGKWGKVPTTLAKATTTPATATEVEAESSPD